MIFFWCLPLSCLRFGIDPEVHAFIRATWQGNYWGSWASWNFVPPEKKDQWWHAFIVSASFPLFFPFSAISNNQCLTLMTYIMFFCSNTTTGRTNSMMKSTWNGRNKLRLPSVAASARKGEITGNLPTCQTLTGQQWLRSTTLSKRKRRVQKLQNLVSLLQLGRRCTSTVQAHAVSLTFSIIW